MAEFYDVLKLPPNADKSEMAVIAGVLAIPGRLDVVIEAGLKPEHFRIEKLQNVYRAALNLQQRGVKQIDVALIANEPDAGLADADDLEELGSLIHHPYLIGDVIAHARSVTAASKQRDMIYALRNGLRLIGESKPAEEVHAVVGSQLDSVFDGGNEGPVHIGDVLLRRADQAANQTPGLASGFYSLDAKLSGLMPATLNILAARPGHGKTALAESVALNAARNDDCVLFVSLEMSRDELAVRLLSLVSGVPHKRIRENTLDEFEQEQVAFAEIELGGLPLQICDRATLRVSDIATAVRLMKRRHGLKLLIVDYLTLIEPHNSKAPKEQQVGDTSRALKMLAKSADIPVLCLAQLNREIERRDDKRPRLSDLRDSGSIEQDADAVLFLHRPGLNDPDADQRAATLTIAKNRHGQTGEIELEWIGHRMEYREADL